MFLLVSFTLQSEEDPLLRKSWIPESIDEEKRFFNKVQTKLLSKPVFIVKKDSWGRNYKLKQDGSVDYLLDEEYLQKFPIQSEPYLSYREAVRLHKEGHWLQAIHLLNGGLLCFRISKTGTTPKKLENLVNSLRNTIIQENIDKQNEIDILTDPYGCYVKEYLVLESEAFNYQINLPKEWEYIYHNSIDEISRQEDEYSYRTQRFVQILPGESKETMEDKLSLAEAGRLNYRKNKVILFIGGLFQKRDIFTSDNFYHIWDQNRGLNPTTMRKWKFTRKERNPGYESSVLIMDELGKSEKFLIREYYFWKKDRGVFLSLSYPESISEEMESKWSNLIQSFKSRSK
jgi:hypothetical protein